MRLAPSTPESSEPSSRLGKRLASVVTMMVLAASPAAWAGGPGGFGGFSSDETSFLRGTDQICQPLPAASKRGGSVACQTGSTAEVAHQGFRRGVIQSGAGASYRVDLIKGTELRVVALASGKCRAAWTTLDPISRIVEVYLSPNGKLIAVEFETRVAGRLRTDVVGLALSREVQAVGGPAPPAVGGPAPPAAGGPGPAIPAADAKALATALKKGHGHLTKRRWAKARAAFADALHIDPDNPEARYGHAAATMGAKDRATAIAELEQLAKSGHPDAIVWLIEARNDPLFRSLLDDPAFRKAVGLDPDPNRPRSAYERLVGLGGRWEQSGISCERPRINLELRRRPPRFDLRLRSKCQGMDETTRLDGTWVAEGASTLRLSFPNPEGKDEAVECQVAVCGDGSGEDCLTCAAGTEMEMQLRVVRR